MGYETELYYNRTSVLFVLIGTNWFLLLNIDGTNIYFYSLHELVLTFEYRLRQHLLL